MREQKEHNKHENSKEHERSGAHKGHEEHGAYERHGEHENHNEWHKAHYAAADINDKLVINLRDISHTMRFLYEGKGSQKRILIILDEAGGSMTQRRLTERLGIQSGSASEVIAKLESTGYIRRTPNETDRRTADIELTETGKASAADARQQRIRRHEEMFSCLSDAEKNELMFLLEKINADWEERYQDVGDHYRQRGHHHGGHRHHGNMHRHKGE